MISSAAIGVAALIITQAASLTTSIEVESGAVLSPARIIADNSASGAGAVMFGQSTSSSSNCLENAGSNIFATSPANGFINNPTWAQESIYIDQAVPDNRVFNATGYSYYYGLINAADASQIYGVRLRQGTNVCWSGGRIISTSVDAEHPIWETWHDLNGFRFGGMPNLIIENLYVRNFGDNINISDNDGDISQNWTIRDTLLRHSHDDCIQNDKLASGKLINSFLDGCYSGISARMSSSDASGSTVDGSNNTLEIENTLLWLQPTTPVYKGDDPGHGSFFKLENDQMARGMKLSLKNVTLMAMQDSHNTTIGITEGTIVPVCQNVTIVWLGTGSFPASSTFPPGCITVKTGEAGKQYWLQKVNEWYAAHPQFLDLKQLDDYYFTYND